MCPPGEEMFRIPVGLLRIRHILPPGAHKVLPYGIKLNCTINTNLRTLDDWVYLWYYILYAAVVELADTRDLKSLAVTGVPVRARSAAPKKTVSLSAGCLFCAGRARTHPNATRMSVAAEGLTEANLHFLPSGENANRARSAAPKKTVSLLAGCLFLRGAGSNPSKCNADERCRRGLDRGEPSFSSIGRKCKSSPVSGTNKRTPRWGVLLLV